MTTLAGIGDRELWYAEGAEWRFPIFVDWKQSTSDGTRYAVLFPAVCPHYAAMVQLKALFEVHNKINRENQWLIRAEMVEALLKKASGITPERYYRWAGKEEKPVSYTKATMPCERQPDRFRTRWGMDGALVTAIADESGLQTSVVKIVLDGLNKVAANYLVAQHRVMDLGFIKLIAVPFRANWKEIVCFKLRKLGLLKYLKEDSDMQSIERAGLPETLCSAHNVAIRREQKNGKGPQTLSRIDYSLEVVTSKAFEKEVTRIETGHRSTGHTAYVGYYEKTVERLYENLLEILRAYRKKIGYPFARIHQSSATGGLRFVETVGLKARAHGRNLRNLPVHICPPRHGFSAMAEESQQELVHSPALEVPALPAFSQAPDDLRQCEERRDLEEFGNGEGGAGGMPLCDVGQIETSREPVLPCSTTERGPSWVEIIGD